MTVESLFDTYYERATTPIRNTTFSAHKRGGFDIRQVMEDDEFRNLNHLLVCKNGSAASVWREQEWGFGENSLDVTHFDNGIVSSISVRHTGDAVKGVKLSLTRGEWLIADPDYRLPYIFGRADIEAWYKVSEFQLKLERVRLAWDKPNKHTFTVLGQGIDKKRVAHLYRDVEYRVEMEDGIRLIIDEKTPRRIDWRPTMNTDEALALFEYVSGDSWIDGWDPVAKIVELSD